ncbi:MAG: DUF503 domain-containing protein [Chloroflexota bacterium]
MRIGLLTIHLRIPGCASLKEKRSQIKPLLARLHREFNISVAEIDYQDTWQNALIGITLVSNDGKHTERTLQKVVTWIEKHHPHLFIVEEHIELI